MGRNSRSDLLFIGLIIVPLVLLVGILIYLPAVDSFYTSFTNENLRIRNPPKIIGFKNYIKLLSGSEFWNVTLRTIAVVVLTLPLELMISLGIALLLTEVFPGRALV